MNVEEALRDAMAAQVAGVHAPPSLGQSVRRRSRRTTVRFRTAGAAVLTAAVAVGVPVALTARPGADPIVGGLAGPGTGAGAGVTTPVPATPSETGSGDTVAVPVGVVPDVVGKSAGDVMTLLDNAGFTVRIVKVVTGDAPEGTVIAQMPAPGTTAPAGAAVMITVATAVVSTSDTTPDAQTSWTPQDLGDLGNGRTLGGVHVGYLPRELEWGKWSGKDGFGTESYTTSWVEPGLEPGVYSIQLIVYRKEAASLLAKRLRGYAAQGAKPVDVDGRRAYLVSLSEGGDRITDGGTRTITWTLASGVGIEVMMSPDYEAKLGRAAADRELRKIAAGVALDR
ncbi:PASTA domain-containing protein [Microbispora sp. NBC_01189]|uniref:PASTA domain-containing protein n=1 Tax=Microbispora sp. NBC_01189 TaxID=2903583 RepID=UPI002E0DD8CA|nr:PASTA domain-containing protein [Microbispora sp. NBC_01189]